MKQLANQPVSIYWWKTVLLILFYAISNSSNAQNKKENSPQKNPPNIIIILTDDHRYDFMGFVGAVPWLRTPALDKIRNDGAWIKNASVSTALCSPSRATLLSGQYAHTHKVVDNFSPLPKGLNFFPSYFQSAGYQTAFFGKWHMGNTDDMPQKGFHFWESFQGQGVYYNPTLNINGVRKAFLDSTYITDLLTKHALEWLSKVHKQGKPFLLYLSHKGVHDEFMPAKRHRGIYAGNKIYYPSTINLTAQSNSKIFGDTFLLQPSSSMAQKLQGFNVADIPQWVKKQRNSWHGVDYMYDGRVSFDEFYIRYAETLQSIDESTGQLLDFLKENGLENNTVVLYLGDNGFMMGELGLIDKRNMYEASMRIPLLMKYPGVIQPGSTLNALIQNVDIAPTLLNIASIPIPSKMQGTNFLPLLKGDTIEKKVRRAYYEYYWEFSYPQTPTTLGIREQQYKFIFYPGIWDISELYDLERDPEEKNNLYRNPLFQPVIQRMRNELWNWLEQTGGMQIPFKKINEKRGDAGYKGFY
jgi:N-acetylglucosamine-6-sulfatase